MADPTAAVLPQVLRDELAGVARAIGPTLHSAGAAGERETRLARVAMVAVHEYAPCAPVEVLVEAATRMGAWLFGDRPHVSQMSITSPDGTTVNNQFNAGMTASGLRHSGASALLAPYRQVRAFEGF